jgi:hypothetical protein
LSSKPDNGAFMPIRSGGRHLLAAIASTERLRGTAMRMKRSAHIAATAKGTQRQA